jgi:cyclopropane-fatty-acyl-phospholipid synthase
MLRQIAAGIIRLGALTVQTPGRTFTVGAGQPHVTIRLHDRRAILELALDPELALGELYMDGRLTVENGRISDLLDLVSLNLSNHKPPALLGFLRSVRRLMDPLRLRNRPRKAKRNVAHHYDLSGRLYDLFLDHDRQYSCAYFSNPQMTLDEAQSAKKQHIRAKLHLDRPGLKVLDVGSGWGGLALDLARTKDAEVTGITLSEEQLSLARQRAADMGLAKTCHFELTDYRQVQGTFDRIVSIGMFEHVGKPNYDAYFEKIARSLAEDGVALIHTVGRSRGPSIYNPWIAKYIFPGGYVPSLSEMLAAIERNGLIVADVEILRQHYAYTLRAWRRRFAARRAEAAALYDERFCRMWEFYLGGCEKVFRHGGLVVFQVQLIKRPDVLPISRNYMYGAERQAPDARQAIGVRSRENSLNGLPLSTLPLRDENSEWLDAEVSERSD